MNQARSDSLPFVAPCRTVTLSAPLRWLALGWQDLKSAPLQSLGYGVLIFCVSVAVSWVAWNYGSGWLLIVMLSTFVFLAPVLGLGIYAISAELARGGKPSLRQILLAERGRLGDALVYSLALLVVGLVWMRAGTAVHIFYPESGQPSTAELAQFFLIGSSVGSIFAAITFAASAFSLPMLLDRKVDGVTAVVTSVNAVLRNKKAMLVWASLIVIAIAVGFATALLGLIVTMPLVGHAAWHAYRETIDASDWPAYP